MKMTNEIAENGIHQILNLLDEDTIMKLVATTTQHLTKPEFVKDKNDAINTILRYSSDYSAILNRKTVKREILFQYLQENNLTIHGSMTKLKLIQTILEYWYSLQQQQQQQQQIVRQETRTITTPETEDDINIMATKFAEWFYAMLNTDESLSVDHFWNDCSLQLNLISPERTIENSVLNNRDQVTQVLNHTKREHNLYFNPNLTENGVLGKMEAHGLVMVFVCGTLHTKEQCVGIFEQTFALARDPYAENNWKVKNTQLNLHSKSTNDDVTIPTLQNCNLLSIHCS